MIALVLSLSGTRPVFHSLWPFFGCSWPLQLEGEEEPPRRTIHTGRAAVGHEIQQTDDIDHHDFLCSSATLLCSSSTDYNPFPYEDDTEYAGGPTSSSSPPEQTPVPTNESPPEPSTPQSQSPSPPLANSSNPRAHIIPLITDGSILAILRAFPGSPKCLRLARGESMGSFTSLRNHFSACIIRIL